MTNISCIMWKKIWLQKEVICEMAKSINGGDHCNHCPWKRIKSGTICFVYIFYNLNVWTKEEKNQIRTYRTESCLRPIKWKKGAWLCCVFPGNSDPKMHGQKCLDFYSRRLALWWSCSPLRSGRPPPALIIGEAILNTVLLKLPIIRVPNTIAYNVWAPQ